MARPPHLGGHPLPRHELEERRAPEERFAGEKWSPQQEQWENEQGAMNNE
jgi:hypothetical protein